VSRASLPAAGDEEFYHADLVGLDVRLPDGTHFGTVRAVHDFGAGDSLEIERADGDVMVPFTKAAVPVVDIAGGFIVLDPPVGLLEKRGA
jgi:16S rRNA processing protein RimM